jgi:hypothetical protein
MDTALASRKLSDTMNRFSGPRSRLAGTLTTPGGTGNTAGADALAAPRNSDPMPPAPGGKETMSDFQAIADRV